MRKREILRLADGDRRESSRMLAEVEDETKSAMEAFFAGLPGKSAAGSAAPVDGDEQDAMDEQEERERHAQRHAPESYGFGPNPKDTNVKDPFIGSAFGRTKAGRGGTKRNWARK